MDQRKRNINYACESHKFRDGQILADSFLWQIKKKQHLSVKSHNLFKGKIGNTNFWENFKFGPIWKTIWKCGAISNFFKILGQNINFEGQKIIKVSDLGP